MSGLVFLFREHGLTPPVASLHGKFRCATIGVDASILLSKAVLRNAVAFCDSRDNGNTDYVAPVSAAFVDVFVALLAKGVRAIVVFYGKALPAKLGAQPKRWQRRQHALELLAAENPDNPMSAETLAQVQQQSVGLDCVLVETVIDGLRAVNMPCLIAPFQADAELVLLNSVGHCDAVGSEDGDLIAAGTPAQIWKLHVPSGMCQLHTIAAVERGSLHCGGTHNPCSCLPLIKLHRKWGLVAFAACAVLAGCDYIKLVGIGEITAIAVLGSTRPSQTVRTLTGPFSSRLLKSAPKTGHRRMGSESTAPTLSPCTTPRMCTTRVSRRSSAYTSRPSSPCRRARTPSQPLGQHCPTPAGRRSIPPRV